MKNLIFLPLLFFAFDFAFAQDSPAAPDEESRLVAVLKSPGKDENDILEKTAACGRLSEIGTEKSVQALIDLLGDERLGDEAGKALEKIPSKKIPTEIRSLLETAKGRRLINSIRILGALRDEESVTRIGILTLDKDEATALAALDSLGKIGSDDAVARLRNTLTSKNPALKNAAATAILETCERLIETESGEDHEKEVPKVVELSRELRGMDDLPIKLRTAATRTLVLGSGEKGIELVLGLLYDEDDAMFEAALEIAREFRNDDFMRVYTSELPDLPPKRQGKALSVLKDRTDLRFLPSTVLKLAKTGSKETKLATIEVIAVHGHGGCIPVLLEILGSDAPDLSKAARDTIESLKGEDYDDSIALELRSENKQIRIAAIELLAKRAVASTKNDLARIASDLTEPDEIRSEAIHALGNLADIEMLSGMLGAMKRSDSPGEKTTWKAAIETAAARMPDRDAAVRKLLIGLEGASKEAKISVLGMLPAIACKTGLEATVAAAADKDATIRDVALESLGQWPGSEAAGPMLLLLESYRKNNDENSLSKTLHGLSGLLEKHEFPPETRKEIERDILEYGTKN